MKTAITFCILLAFFSIKSKAQQKNTQSTADCVSQNYRPFTDKDYVITIKNCPLADANVRSGNNATITLRKGKQVLLKDSLYIRFQNDFLTFKDFNGDGIKDVLIFSETGGRGGNAFYYLYLIDAKNKKINRVKGFENVVNPEYDKKLKVIVAYGLSGTNNYSIYKISKNNKVYQIGKSFEDTFESDDDVLNKKIIKILKAGKK